jgi:light-harvesting complex II chlorophyll a/b binding protein 5
MQVQAFFKKAAAAPAKKAAGKAPAKKATTVVKPSRSGSKATRGWLGGEGGANNLDKWYGKQQSSAHWKTEQS